MARALRSFEFRPFRRTRYPWLDWLDGRAWKLVRGEDFTLGTERMRQRVHAAARSRRLRVRTARDGDDLIIQAFGSNETGPGKGAA